MSENKCDNKTCRFTDSDARRLQQMCLTSLAVFPKWAVGVLILVLVGLFGIQIDTRERMIRLEESGVAQTKWLQSVTREIMDNGK